MALSYCYQATPSSKCLNKFRNELDKEGLYILIDFLDHLGCMWLLTKVFA